MPQLATKLALQLLEAGLLSFQDLGPANEADRRDGLRTLSLSLTVVNPLSNLSLTYHVERLSEPAPAFLATV